MDLSIWMKRERWRDREFANEINAIVARRGWHRRPISWRSVIKWRSGASIPRPHIVEAIEIMTQGEVALADHIAKNEDFLAQEAERKESLKGAST